MMTATLLMLLNGPAHAGSADAADHEVSLELGTLGSRDENFSMFSSDGMLPSAGGRIGYAVMPRWSVLADYQYGRYGGGIESEVIGADGDYDYAYSDMDLTVHQLSIGPKFDLPVTHWLRPYATVQGMGLLGRLGFAEDGDEDSRVRYGDTAAGGLAAVGIDLVPGAPRARLHLASHLEMGYARAFALDFSDPDAGNTPADIGDIALGGYYLRWGVGIRF